MGQRRYDRQGILAVNPQAFFDMFVEAPARETARIGNAAIVDVRGPLEQHPGFWCDSYAAILERVAAACASDAEVVVLRIDSPGGVAAGMTDTAREIRALCAAAGKSLVSFVEGQACSAAYALACSARTIVASETGILGSIGVINARIDVTEADRLTGVRFAIQTSGDRKSDGHPHVAVTDAEMVATQSLVDSLALTFFDLVSEMRGMPRASIAGLEAGLFHGARAVAVGLADRVQSFQAMLATLASGAEVSMSKYEDARAALGELAGGEGEEAVKARKALAAMDEPDEEKKDEPESSAPAAEDEAPPPADEEKKEPESAKALRATVSAATAGALAAQSNDLAARVARLEAQAENALRKALLASRPDLQPDLVKLLATKPLADVQAIVGAIPAPRTPKLGDKAAAASVTPTQGATSSASRLPPEQKAELDRAMGLRATQSIGVEKSDYRLVLGAPVDVVRKGS